MRELERQIEQLSERFERTESDADNITPLREDPATGEFYRADEPDSEPVDLEKHARPVVISRQLVIERERALAAGLEILDECPEAVNADDPVVVAPPEDRSILRSTTDDDTDEAADVEDS